MNTLRLIFILNMAGFLSACANLGDKRGDHWFGADKAKHFAASAAIGAGSSAVLHNNGHSECDAATAGIMISLTVGAGKEYHDKYVRKTYWSWKDMAWNLLGAAVGSHLASGCN